MSLKHDSTFPGAPVLMVLGDALSIIDGDDREMR